jgi:peptidoglycan/xylan/chitin deacetylase (PgdA/CDA1 family)
VLSQLLPLAVMHRYFIKTPWWAKCFFAIMYGECQQRRKVVYLTFDDGPHPEATPFVLDELNSIMQRPVFFVLEKM